MDFDLSDEILSVIPTDPYEQLDLARRITAMAIAARVNRLEADAAALRKEIADRDASADELRARASRLAARVADAETRLRVALEENAKLAKERDSFALEAKKMSKNLAKLETFKRQLKESLSDDTGNLHAEMVDDANYGNSVAHVPTWNDEASSSRGVTSIARISTITDSVQDGFSTPVMTSARTSPTRLRYDGRSAFSAWPPSSQQSSSVNSPPDRRSFAGRPRIDGKEFFRQARTRLSYEQFGAFLANIKEFNAQKQSREETLLKAEHIFGPENKDLFTSFQNMLNRSKS